MSPDAVRRMRKLAQRRTRETVLLRRDREQGPLVSWEPTIEAGAQAEGSQPLHGQLTA